MKEEVSMKFCKNCGYQLTDEALFCPKCGTSQASTEEQPVTLQPTEPQPMNQEPTTNESPVLESVSPQPVYQEAANPQPTNQQTTPPPMYNGAIPSQNSSAPTVEVTGKKNVAIIIGVVAIAVFLLVFVIIIFSVLFSKPYKKPIATLINGINNQKMATVFKSFPEFIVEDSEETFEYELEEYYDDDEVEYWESFLGDDDYKITYKIDRAKKLDSDDLEDYVDEIDDYYDEDVKITGGYKVTVDLSVEIDDEEESLTTKMIILKIDGKWCIYDAGDLDFF